jgi:hypothetical protein
MYNWLQKASVISTKIKEVVVDDKKLLEASF